MKTLASCWPGASRQIGGAGLVAKTIRLYGLQDAPRVLEAGRQARFIPGARGAGRENR